MSRRSAQNIASAKKWLCERKQYLPIATFGPFRWFEQIKKRIDIEAAFLRNDQDFLNRSIPCLIDNPLGPYIVESALWMSWDKHGADTIVRDLDVSDVKQLHQLLERAADDVSQAGATLRQLQLRPAALGLAASVTEGYLVVRLDAKDSEIISGVRSWLSGRRKLSNEAVLDEWEQELLDLANAMDSEAAALRIENNEAAELCLQLAALYRRLGSTIKNRFVGSDLMPSIQSRFESWYDRKVILYFDLRAWERWSGIRLNDQERSALLFPPNEAGRTADLKLTKQLTLEVFCDECVWQLLHLGLGRPDN